MVNEDEDTREFDFSKAERGRRFDLSKGYSYPCGDCRQTGKVDGADCPRCGGAARIVVGPEQARREQAEHEANCERWMRRLRAEHAGERPKRRGERCPDCRGRGEIPEKLKGPDGAKQESVPCPRCHGEGVL